MVAKLVGADLRVRPPALSFETTNEFWFVWERLKPLVPVYREFWGNPDMQKHLERAATRYEKYVGRRAPGFLDKLRQFSRQMGSAGGGQNKATD